jgi:chromate reductase
MKILAISGSLRAASHNTALLRAAAEHAPEGVEIELYEGLDRLPPYNEDRDTGTPPVEVERLRDEIAAADGVLLSTPEYNGTIPGH